MTLQEEKRALALTKSFAFSRVDWVAIAILVIATMAIFTPVVHAMISRSDSDHGPHLRVATQLAETGQILRPQFLYHVSIVAVYRLFNGQISIETAALIVEVAFRAALGALIYILFCWVWDRPRTSRSSFLFVVLALGLMLVTPINFLSWSEGEDGRLSGGYNITNVYHNPTSELLEPLALAFFIIVAPRLLRIHSENRRITWLIAAVLIVLGTLAKPNYTIVILPVMGLIGLYRFWKKEPFDWFLFIVGVIIPAGIVLLWQFNFHEEVQGRGFAFSLFHFSRPRFPETPLSLLFPLAVYFLYLKDARKDTIFNLVWLVFGVGLAYQYMFIELNSGSGRNFVHGARASLLIVFIVAMAFLLRQNIDSFKRSNWKLIACMTILALHVICGFYWYYVHLVDNDFQRWWQ
jgi:hypothetical protein